MSARFQRLAETGRATLTLCVDGHELQALAGDTLLSAILCAAQSLRQSEFGPEARAGFCLMGACQDCWVWSEDGQRIRACTTTVSPGMRILRTAPDACWFEAPPAEGEA
jgi:predicted molibdopterin-dependent oxidoreductase YjgC